MGGFLGKKIQKCLLSTWNNCHLMLINVGIFANAPFSQSSQKTHDLIPLNFHL